MAQAPACAISISGTPIKMSNSPGRRPRRTQRQAQEPPAAVDKAPCEESRPSLPQPEPTAPSKTAPKAFPNRTPNPLPTAPTPRPAALLRELSTKRRGELAELAFLHKATALGFRLSKPYGDSDRYDFITDSGNRLYRIQVKCTTTMLEGFYHLPCQRSCNGKAIPYTHEEIDFFAALVVPEDSWFIIPITHVLGITSFLFRRLDDPSPSFYSPYREAWPLLCEPDGLTFG